MQCCFQNIKQIDLMIHIMNYALDLKNSIQPNLKVQGLLQSILFINQTQKYLYYAWIVAITQNTWFVMI
jgi:hypothetical protein